MSLVAQQKEERKEYRDAAAANSSAAASSSSSSSSFSSSSSSSSSAPPLPPPLPPVRLPFSFVSRSVAVVVVAPQWRLCHVEFHHPSAADVVSTLMLHFRHAASARYKRRDEENTFVFGSLRAVKGRTAAMRGANPIPRKKRKRSRHSAGGDSSGSSSDDSGDDNQPSAAAVDSGSAESVLLSYTESWIHMLTMITSVSEERAAVIARHYPTVRALTDAYQAVPHQYAARVWRVEAGQRRGRAASSNRSSGRKLSRVS